jgi:hypothetical protein
MVNHAPLCLNQEEAVGAGQEEAQTIQHATERASSSSKHVHTRGGPEVGRRQIRRGSARSVASRPNRPSISYNFSDVGVHTDDETAYKTLACALIHQAYLDATNKQEYLRPNRENDRAEHERSAIHFFESRAYRILCEILNIDPETITNKINETN